MNDFRVPIVLSQTLARYYERVLRCAFTLNGDACAASEVFHRHGFLPLIVEAASARSQQILNEPIPAEITPYEKALLGRTVTALEQTALILLLLTRAAEVIFRPAPGHIIELYPVFEYGWTPLDKRSRAAWELIF